MRVLHLAPLWFPVAEDSLGGVETFLAALLPTLREHGVEPGLVATANSSVDVDVEVIPAAPRDLFPLGTSPWDYWYSEQDALFAAVERAGSVDLIHSHIGPGGFVLSAPGAVPVPVLHTLHNPIEPMMEWFVRRHSDLWLSTVSAFQATILERCGATRVRTIHNGLRMQRLRFHADGGRGLVFLGRIEEDKGTDLAIEVAASLGLPIIVAGPIVDDEYFDERIRPALGPEVRHVGVVGQQAKNDLLGDAGCVLVPSIVHEGCPLVPMEAMACGTPVVALANGALPELVDEGCTGFTTAEPSELPALTERAMRLDRGAIRRRAEARFDIGVVGAKYAALYAEILEGR